MVLVVDRSGVEQVRLASTARLPARQQPVLDPHDVFEAAAELVTVEIAETDRQRSPHLVAIAGADAAAGRADRLASRQTAVELLVFGHVPRKHEVGPVADPQLAFDPHAAALEHIDLLDHAGGIEGHATGDDAGDVVAEDAAWNEGELPGLAVGDDGVAGVGAALIADDDLVVLGEDVNEFAFGFVTPLQTDNACAGHGRRSSLKGEGENGSPGEAAELRPPLRV
jgi:hypothetical protein